MKSVNYAPTYTPHHGALHGHHHEHAMDGQAEILDLDAEVLAEHTASITAWLPLQTDPRHSVDLGCGTGAVEAVSLWHNLSIAVSGLVCQTAMVLSAP